MVLISKVCEESHLLHGRLGQCNLFHSCYHPRLSMATAAAAHPGDGGSGSGDACAI